MGRWTALAAVSKAVIFYGDLGSDGYFAYSIYLDADATANATAGRPSVGNRTGVPDIGGTSRRRHQQ